MEQRLSIVTLGVADLAASREFYGRLGWTPSPASNESVAFYDAGGVVFGLYGREALAEDACVDASGGGFRGVSVALNVREKAHVDAVLEEAEAAGGRILKPAQDVFWGGYSGYFADPDGHLWEVAWNPFFPLDEEGRVTLPA